MQNLIQTNRTSSLNVGTYRGRGWCVIELFASYLSRDSTFPTLLITSNEGNPEWVSILDTLNLAVGTSDFTCCQRNHIFGDKVVTCDRGITRTILEGMIEAKVHHYFKLEQTLQARFCMCLASWWLRVESTLSESQSESLESFLASLRVKISNTEWADECGVPILFYAVVQNNVGKAFVCYRTWCRRAFCVLELFASYLSRRQSFPVLLVQSSHEKPKWISAVEAQKLGVGTSTFSCCEMNHPNGMECDKIASWEVLDKLIQGRVKYDHEVVGSVVNARLTFVLRSWWQRELLKDDPLQVTSLDDFKFHLRWKDNEDDV